MKLTYRGVTYEPVSPLMDVLATSQEDGIFLGTKSKIKRYRVTVSHRAPVRLNYRGVPYVG